MIIMVRSTDYNVTYMADTKGCNGKNVTESLNVWPHLGDGVSWTWPESQRVEGRKWLEQFDSRFKRLHHPGVARDWET